MFSKGASIHEFYISMRYFIKLNGFILKLSPLKICKLNLSIRHSNYVVIFSTVVSARKNMLQTAL